MNRFQQSFVMLIGAPIAALCFSASALAGDAGMLKMRFTQSGNTSSSWPLYVAEQKKMFEKNGLQVEVIIIRGATNVVRAVLSETIPIGRINPDYVIGASEKHFCTSPRVVCAVRCGLVSGMVRILPWFVRSLMGLSQKGRCDHPQRCV